MQQHNGGAIPVGKRPAGKKVPGLMTSFNSTLDRAAASRIQSTVPNAQPQSQAPSRAPSTRTESKLERRPSKMSLFNLFSKPKVERARGYHEGGLSSIPEPQPQPSPVSVAPPRSIPTAQSTPVVALAKPQQRVVDSALSKMRTTKGSISRRPKPVPHWEPPPLFQAYPQAIKYATLQAPTSSVEDIAKASEHKRQTSVLQEGFGDGGLTSSSSIYQQGSSSGSVSIMTEAEGSSPEVTTKIYVLVTSGFLLQYAGTGPSERLPEKVLQLGPDSAAFASDMIPGKYWVLQICQATNEDGSMQTAGTSKTLFSKFGLQSAASKRAAFSFLLVLDSADEMSSWLHTVRKEIDTLAGRTTRLDEYGRPKAAATTTRKVEPPSHRYQLQRDPSRFDSERSPLSSPIDSPTTGEPGWERQPRLYPTRSDAGSTTSSRRLSVRQSTEAASIATTAVSNDQAQLNQLRESSRLSIVSRNSEKTVATSRGSSPGPPSPSLPEAYSNMRSFNVNPSTSSSDRRRSVQALPTTNEDHTLPAERRPQRLQRHSTYGAAGQPYYGEPVLPSSTAHVNRILYSPVVPPSRSSPVKRASPYRSSSVPAPTMALPNVPSTAAQLSQPPVPIPPKSEARLSESPTSIQPAIGGPLEGTSDRSNAAATAVSAEYAGPIGAPLRSQTELAPRPISTISSLPNELRLKPSTPPTQAPPPLPSKSPRRLSASRTPNEVRLPRRVSSLLPPPLPLTINTTALSRPSPPMNASPTQAQKAAQMALRRPASVQIRSDPAPFLSSSTYRGYNRSVSTPLTYQASRSVTPTQRMMSRTQVRQSLPVIGLPPPAPPPTMPLPPPPSTQLTV